MKKMNPNLFVKENSFLYNYISNNILEFGSPLKCKYDIVGWCEASQIMLPGDDDEVAVMFLVPLTYEGPWEEYWCHVNKTTFFRITQR